MMPKMSKSKILGRIAVALVVALVGIALVLQFCLGSVIKTAAETFAPAALGTDVKIKSVKLNLARGECRFKGVVVGPPEGYKANVFELADFHALLDVRSLFTDTIVVRKVSIIKPKVAYELSGIRSNVGAILERLQKGAEKTKEVSEGGKKFVVEHFIFSGAEVKLASATLGMGVPIPLPSIELRDVGRKGGGITALELAAQIFSFVGGGIINAAGSLVLGVGGAALDGAKAIGNVAAEGVGLVGDGAKLVGDGAKAVGGAAVDGVKAVGGAVMGLFSSGKEEQPAADAK